MTELKKPTVNHDDAKRCPQCDLINPAKALFCDCGFNFQSAPLETSGLEQRNSESPEASAKTPRSALWQLFGLSGPLSARTYLQLGALLVVVKYGADALLFYLYTGKLWHPLAYLTRLGVMQAPLALQVVLLVWTLPFLWIGLALTLRRTVDSGHSAWLALVYFVPVLNYVLMLTLCVSKSVKRHARADRRLHARSDDVVRSVMLCAATSVIIAIGAIGFNVYVLQQYGNALFLGTPVVMGAVSGYLFNRSRLHSLPFTLGVACISIGLAGASLLLFALEGSVCILMAAPVALMGGILGALIGRAVAADGASPHQAWLVVLALPLLSGFDSLSGESPRWEVSSAIEIEAPPERVWQHVIGFTELPPPDELLFRAGIAFPQRAHIEGSGVGAMRYCEFSTGPFVEPITRWDPPSRLSFDVSRQPAPMHEWSPYRNLHPPHLDGYFRSVAGEFRLVPLEHGRTRLEGTTWYKLDLAPGFYWKMWSDALVHAIHLRVLQHVKRLSELDVR